MSVVPTITPDTHKPPRKGGGSRRRRMLLFTTPLTPALTTKE